MFSDDFSEDWDSTANQDSFIKKYFARGKVLSQKAQLTSKPADDSGSIPAVKNSKNMHINQHSENGHDDSGNTSHVRNKRSLIDQSESNKKRKKVKKSSNKFSQDNYIKDCENGIECQEIQMKDSYNSESNCLKTKKKKKSKNKNISEEDFSEQMNNTEKRLAETKNTVCAASHSSIKKNNLFQNKMYKKLQAAKFRYLNEILYTNAGKDALSYFEQNTDEFQDYHVGYQSQVSKWPINPVDIFIQEICQMNKQAVIADLGCGEAKIAEVFPKRTVHSFDLIALKDCVTACDMANVPLPSNSVDVAVFCLSLMGTNWKDYIKEGHRLLKLDGLLKIAEIESRIENLLYFIKNIEKCGFSLVNKDASHKMFVFLNFKKVNRSKKSSKVPDITLKPCLYKKR